MNKFSFLFLIVILFVACSAEHHMIKAVQADLKKTSLLLLFPENLDAVNNKSGLDLNKLTDKEYDSLFYSADFLPYIYRDSFLLQFQEQIISEFEKDSFRVYTDKSWSRFLQQSGPSYIVNFNFLQLEESYMTHLHTPLNEDSKKDGKAPSVSVKMLNTLSLNAWVEFAHVQDTTLKRYSYFMKYELADSVSEGPNSECAETLCLDSLSLADISNLGDQAAAEMQSTTIDFLINQKVEKRIGHMYNRYPYFFLKYKDRKTIKKTDIMPNYIFINVE